MNDTQDLILRLTTGLQAQKPRLSIWIQAFTWLVISGVITVLLIHMSGPIRSNALSQLFSTPRFALEIASGISAIAALAVTGFLSAVPAAAHRGLFLLTLLSLTLFLGLNAYALFNPPLAPSTLGKREHCLYETFVYGILPLAFAWHLISRYYPLNPGRTAAMLGLSAGLMSAVYMQIACVYEPVHMFIYHLMPASLLGLSAALCTLWRTRFHTR